MKNTKNKLGFAASLALLLFFIELFSKAGGMLQKAFAAPGGKAVPEGAQPGAEVRLKTGEQVILADACTEEKKKDVMFIGCNGMYE